MSHFTVLVTGECIEQQLQPFHEFECTGENDEYVQDIDITDEVLDKISLLTEGGEENPLTEALEWFGLDDVQIEDENQAETQGEHKYGYAVVQKGTLIKAINRTNPNKKWDWWQVGGRWSGFFKLKEGKTGEVGSTGLFGTPAKEGWADSALKGDIDWEGMQQEAGEEAGARWDRMRGLAPETWLSWKEVQEQHESMEIAREVYNSQPQVEAIRKEDVWANPDDFLKSRERYVDLERKSSVSPFAVLHEGQWIERGEMGWFACISGDMGKETWMDKVWKLIQSLPEDKLLTIVDCHI